MKIKNKKYFSIKKNKDFKKLFDRGKRVFSPTLVMLYKKNTQMMIGICVGKQHGNSVKRNRAKRLVREAFKNLCDNIVGTYSFVFMPKAKEEYNYFEIFNSLQSMLKREGLLK